MDDSRPSSPGAGAVPRKLVPPPALCGFLLLLALLFTVSYAVGASAGPVAPGMHGTGSGKGTGSGDGTSTGGTGGGMQDMDDAHSGGN
ncbi:MULTISPECIES: hypothetical protein [unclassified Streptomyces]|uniref:hypothetical protein n=1 Tax=unclassified Streptomyces TaxID=2593676 RepID=UPI000FFE4C92|nr:MULTISPECIES: hypothetical protein [unclassified Streptomyces]